MSTKRSRIPSPARSEGAARTPRRYAPSPRQPTRTLRTPPRASRPSHSRRSSGFAPPSRPGSDSYQMRSPRRSILTDNTEIDAPRRLSWWKKVGKNSIDIGDVLGNNPVAENNFGLENNLDFEQPNIGANNQQIIRQVLNLENMSDSNSSESLGSINIPQRKLFTHRQTKNANDFKNIVERRQSLRKHRKEEIDKTINIPKKYLFPKNKAKDNKHNYYPVPGTSNNVTTNTTGKNGDGTITIDTEGLKKNLFKKKPANNLPTFTNFIMSESEDDTTLIQERLMAFKKNPPVLRQTSHRASKRPISPTSSVHSETMEMDNWKLLPSSTMVGDDLVTSTPAKKLCRDKTIDEVDDDDGEKHTSIVKQNKMVELSNNHIKDKSSRQNGAEVKAADGQKEVANESKNVMEVEEESDDDQHKIQDKPYDNQKGCTVDKQGFKDKNESRKELVDAMKYGHNDLAKTGTILAVNDELSQQNCEEVETACEQNEEADESENDTEVVEKSDKDETNQGKSNKTQHECSVDIRGLENENNREITGTELEGVSNQDEIVEPENDQAVNDKLTEHNGEELETASEQNEEADESENGTKVGEEDNSADQNMSQEKSDDNQNECSVDNQEIEDEYDGDDQNGTQDKSDDSKIKLALDNQGIEDEDDDDDQIESQDKSDDNQIELALDNEGIEDGDDDDDQIESQDKSDDNQIECSVDKQGSEIEDENNEQIESKGKIVDNQNECSVDSQGNKKEDGNYDHNVSQDKSDNQNECSVDNQAIEDEYDDDDQNKSQDKSNDNQSECSVNNQGSEDEDDDDGQNKSQDKSDDNQSECSVDNQSSEGEDDNNEQNESQDKFNDNQNDIEDEEQEESVRSMVKNNLDYEVDNFVEDIRNEEHGTSDEEIDDFRINSINKSKSHGNNTLMRTIPFAQIDKMQNIGNLSKFPDTEINHDPGSVSNDEISNRYSAEFSKKMSDGVRSSTEGSGWNSHTTHVAKVAEQTMQQRKSLRTLVLNKATKTRSFTSPIGKDQSYGEDTSNTRAQTPRQDNISITSNSPANSTSLVSNIDVKRTQATMESYIKKIRNENLLRNQKIQQEVKNAANNFHNDPPSDPNIENRFFQYQPCPARQKTKPKDIKKNVNMMVIDGKVYKPPKLFKPPKATWITKNLYQFLNEKLRPKYQHHTRVESEKFVQLLFGIYKHCVKKGADVRPPVSALKKRMAQLGLVSTHFDFYVNFAERFMPKDFCVKIIPNIVNRLPMPKSGVFSEIIPPRSLNGSVR